MQYFTEVLLRARLKCKLNTKGQKTKENPKSNIYTFQKLEVEIASHDNKSPDVQFP